MTPMTCREAETLARVYDAVDLALKTGNTYYVWDDQGCILLSDKEPCDDYIFLLATISHTGTVH